MNIEELKKLFSRKRIIRDIMITYIFMIAGILLFVVMSLLATIPDRGGNFYYLLQNVGFFFLFSSCFVVYAAIHRGNIAPGEHSLQSLIVDSAKQSHIIMGVLLCPILAIFIVALVEMLFSFIGYIPYAGPAIVGLLSLPLFVINIAVITAAVLIWIVTPPMIGEGTGLKQLPRDMFDLGKKRGLIILGYTMFAFILLIVMFGPVLVIIRYSAGITRAVQWDISAAYPSIFKPIMRSSYITDIVGKIAPRTDPIAALKQYGSSIFNYIEMLGTVLKITYGIVLTALVSFFLSLFFNIMSYCYILVHKGVL